MIFKHRNAYNIVKYYIENVLNILVEYEVSFHILKSSNIMFHSDFKIWNASIYFKYEMRLFI